MRKVYKKRVRFLAAVLSASLAITIARQNTIRVYADQADTASTVTAVETASPQPTAPEPANAPQSGMTVVLTIDDKSYTKNGDPAELDVAPYIDRASSRTMVPIRFVAEAFGAVVDWSDAEQTDYIYLNSDTPLKIALNQPLPDNMGTAVLVDDRLFVPVRYVSEQLGAQIDWDAAAKTVTITMDDMTYVPEPTQLPGGYTADRAVTDDDLKVFDEAMAGIMGVNYDPTLVATQVVAGLNYRFTATATVVYPNAVPYTVYIYIYKPLQGPAQLTEIVND